MNINENLIECINNLLELFNTIEFASIALFFVIVYHILLLITKDRKYIKRFKENYDPDSIMLNDLNELPHITIIIPAWNEGKEFKDCLYSIEKLSYPHINVIVNAGGNEETIKIANSYKQFEKFTILEQKRGAGKFIRGKGKIRAINECLNYVSKGIVFFFDADCYITDEIIIRMLYPIVNGNEAVVTGAGSRPLKALENIDFVQYVLISRIGRFKIIRYNDIMLAGANTCMKYEVLKDIGKFEEDRVVATDISRGYDIISKGYKIFCLTDYRSAIYTDYPKNFRELHEQRKRYLSNSLINSVKNRKIIPVMKYIFLLIISFYILISPIFLFFNTGLFIIGLLMVFFFYLKNIRRILIFKSIYKRGLYPKFNKSLFIKMVYFIIIELFINVLTIFSLNSVRKRLKNK
ncbi:MAG: glycosyltransferase [Promethearchaeota archaeon]